MRITELYALIQRLAFLESLLLFDGQGGLKIEGNTFYTRFDTEGRDKLRDEVNQAIKGAMIPLIASAHEAIKAEVSSS